MSLSVTNNELQNSGGAISASDAGVLQDFLRSHGFSEASVGVIIDNSGTSPTLDLVIAGTGDHTLTITASQLDGSGGITIGGLGGGSVTFTNDHDSTGYGALSRTEMTMLETYLGNDAGTPPSAFDKMLAAMVSAIDEKFQQIMNSSTVMASGIGVDGLDKDQLSKVMVNGKSLGDILKEDGTTQDGSAMSISDLVSGLKDGSIPADNITLKTTSSGTTLTYVVGSTSKTFTIPATSDLTIGIEGKDSDGTAQTISASDFGDLNVELTNADDIMSSPGQIMLFQQLLQPIKDALSSEQATAKTAGDTKKESNQNYVQNMH